MAAEVAATFTQALAPAFAAGVAVQRAVEIVDISFVDKEPKKAIIGWVSLVLGVLFAWQGNILILSALKITSPMLVDGMITALVISAGTEGVNSILKLLGYKKDDVKAAQAAGEKSNAPAGDPLLQGA